MSINLSGGALYVPGSDISGTVTVELSITFDDGESVQDPSGFDVFDQVISISRISSGRVQLLVDSVTDLGNSFYSLSLSNSPVSPPNFASLSPIFAGANHLLSISVTKLILLSPPGTLPVIEEAVRGHIVLGFTQPV